MAKGLNKWTIELMKKGWFELIWNSFANCWDFVIDKNTYYIIQENSIEAQAYKEKIGYWIGKNWFYLEKNWEPYKNEVELQKVKDVFVDNTWNLLKDKYFTNGFCSWDIYMYPKLMLDWSTHCQILDSRTVKKEVDSFWNIKQYVQRSGSNVKNISPDGLYNAVIRFDPQNPIYWKSIYKWIVYDAMSDTESSKRQFYFFRNNAVPWAMVMLDDNITDVEVIKRIEQQIKEKYQWSENAHKVMIAWWVKDVRILELSNKDLDLLGLRNFLVKRWGIIFKMDPRIIWFMQDSGADRSITAIRAEAKETLQNMAEVFEQDINNFYKQFINKNMNFIIKLDNETFVDRISIEDNQRKDLILWLQTINEIREERNLPVFENPNAKEPLIWNNLTLLSLLWIATDPVLSTTS